MESKKINQLATNVNPQTSDLTTIGDPITGQLKKITWLQVAHLIGAQAAVTLQQVTDNGNTTTDPITTGGLTLTNLGTGVPQVTNGEFVSTYGYGLANGVATLDSGGKIPASQLPSSVMEYKGTWNASTNTPTLADGTGDNGDVYLVNVAGSQNLGSGTISFAVGDWVVYNGTIWQKSLNSNAVASVFGRTGTIVAQEGDYNIDQLGDVAITSAATNDYLRYNGTGWVNTQFPTFVSSDKLVLQVRNNSGATINKGTVVYVNGATAGYPTIAKALANDDATSAQTIGMVQDNISNNSNGVVVIVGQITGIDTSAYTAGTQLYLSGTTAGTVTSTKPYAPLHLVYVGIVTTQNAVNGVIEVKVQNGVELEELHNVDALNPNNNDGIFYNSTSELWEHKSISTVLGYTPEQPLTFSSPLSRSTNTVSIPAATGSVNGYLTSTDWTTFNNKLSAAITSLNGLTAATQTFATGSSGTDFNISSSTSTHTFNIPSASATNRGLVTTGTQTFAGDKTFNGVISGTTAAFSGALAGYGLSVTNIEDSSQGLLVRSTDADTTLYLARFQSSASSVSTTWVDRFSIAKNGSTVIGDNAPFVNVRLYVKGSSTSLSDYALNLADSNGADIAWFANDKTARFNGNVGIGKTPSVALDVVGAGTFSGNLGAANLSGTNTGDQTLSGLGGVPTTRTLTINGTTYDLSANRTWSVGTIGGSGTSGYVPKFTASTTIGNSLIYDNGVRAISIGNSSTNSWASPFYVIEGGSYGGFLGFQTNAADVKFGVGAYWNGSNYVYTNTSIGFGLFNIGGDSTNGYLDFYGAPASTAGLTATPTKKFGIDNAGNGHFVESIGVGFTSGTPNGRIDFRNPANAIIVGKNTVGGTNTYSSIRLTTANSGGVGDSIGEIRGLSTNSSNRDIALTFLTTEGSGSQTEKLRIAANGAATFSSSVTASGNFITSNSNVVLGVGNTSNNESVVFSYNSNASSRSWRILKDWTAFGDFQIQQSTTQTGSTYTPRLVIDPSGNVGIGTTSISNPISFIRVLNISGGDAGLVFSNTNGTAKNWSIGAIDSGSFVFFDGASERMRITSAGDMYLTGRSTNGDYGMYFYSNDTDSRIYSSNSGAVSKSLIFYTSGNPRMTITSGGNVLLGTTDNTAAYRLNVAVNGGSAYMGVTNQAGGSGDRYLRIGFGTGATVASIQGTRVNVADDVNLALQPDGGNVGIGTTDPSLPNGGGLVLYKSDYPRLQFRNSTSGTGSLDGAGFFLSGNNFYISNRETADIVFEATANTERMRITSGGYLKASNNNTHSTTGNYHDLRNSASGSDILYMVHSAASPYGIEMRFSGASPNNTGNWFFWGEDSTALRIRLNSDGGLANYQANNQNLSDIRTKKDIISLESYWDKFKALEIVKFKYNDQTHDDYNIGVIAQQVESVAPEFVDVDGWGETPEDGVPLKSIYTADLYHATIKVLQEAMEKIEVLESELAILKNK